MDLARQIDIYCERVSAAFWAEPLNAVTNVVFIIAGVAALMTEGREGRAGTRRQVLAGILMAAGITGIFAHTIGLLFALNAGPLYTPLVVPVYAASLACLVAGLLAQPMAWASPGPNWPVAWLSGNAIVVGIGSFLFHTYAQPWAGAADSGPIVMFILGFFVVAMNRFVGLGWGRAALVTAGFLIAMLAMATALRYLRTALPGDLEILFESSSYYPALAALLVVGLWVRANRDPGAGRALLQAGGVFAVSLTFRSLDEPICEIFPWGTHFLWHICNGIVFWILLRGLVRHGRVPGEAPRRAPASAPA